MAATKPPTCEECGEVIGDDDRAVSERQSGPGQIDRYHLECWHGG